MAAPARSGRHGSKEPRCDSLARSSGTPVVFVRGAMADFIRGEHTPRFFTAINAAVSKCIAGSKAATITKASHAMSGDNPMEFNGAVMGFIGQHAAQMRVLRPGRWCGYQPERQPLPG